MKALGKYWCSIVHEPLQAPATGFRGRLGYYRRALDYASASLKTWIGTETCRRIP